MKLVSVVTVMLCMFIVPSISSGTDEKLLSSKQIRALFTEKTMTVTNVKDSKKGDSKRVKLYTSQAGTAQTLLDEGETRTRIWHVTDDGRICFSRPITRRNQGSTCGQIVYDGQGVYRMYLTKDIKQNKNGRISGASKKDLLLEFSNFKKGSDL